MQKKQIIRIKKNLKFAQTKKEYIKLLKQVFVNYLNSLHITDQQRNLLLQLYSKKITEENVLNYLNFDCLILLNYLLK